MDSADISSLEDAFRFLRPMCVLVTQNHDEKSVETLKEILVSDKISLDFVQELQEYIAFPLRLILKQFHTKDEKLCIETLKCITTLLSKTSVVKKEICIDLFNTFLNIISPPSKQSADVSEEVKYAAVEAVGCLVRTCSFSCNCSLMREALPLVGALISKLLLCADKEKLRNLQLSSLNCLSVILDHRQDGELKRLVEKITPGFLPGVVTTLTRILLNPKQNSKVLQIALKCMQLVICSSLPDSPTQLSDDELGNFSQSVRPLLINKTADWHEKTTKNVHAVLEQVSKSCAHHENWIVRAELVDMAYHLLKSCHQTLEKSKLVLMDILVSHVDDDYQQVSVKCQKYVTECQQIVDGVTEMLEERVYELATKLPRLLSASDERQSLCSLKLFSGYLKCLSQQITTLLNSYTHLERITQALLFILELDCNGIHILDSTSLSSEQSLETSSLQFPLLRRSFVHFRDDKIWFEVQTCLHCFSKHGALYGLIDYYCSKLVNDPHHRPQCALILNEIILFQLSSRDQAEGCINRELLDSCRTLLEVYTTYYTDHLISSDNQLNIKQKNERIQLQCLLLEGIVHIHQITGSDYSELLLHSLYLVLELCAHENVLVMQTAVNGLNIISLAFRYSGSAELIEKHCNYLANILSLNIRNLRRYPSSPLVLQSVIKYSQKTILPFIEQLVVEVLLSLDENFIDSALSLLRIPQTLLRQLCLWYNHVTTVDQSEQPPIQPEISKCQGECNLSETLTVDSKVKEVVDFVMNFYRTKKIAEDVDFSEEIDDTKEPEVQADEDINDVYSDDKKEPLPLHIILTKKVLDRCRHLVSHKNAKVRLVCIDMISDGCRVLSELQNELLPMVHECWSGLSKRFSDAEPLVVIKAIDCLSVLGDLAKDFIRARVSKEVISSLSSKLLKQSQVSKQTGKAYRHTLDYKLQLKLLQTAGSLAIDLKIGYPVLETVVRSCLPYLSQIQPHALQQVAVESLEKIAHEDADLVWYLVQEFIKQEGLEFSNNADLLLKCIESCEY